MSEPAAMQATARPPGRPRSAESHQAILRATLELLAEHGFGATSMDAVAARAGVSKATIYRRWKSKQELVEELLGHLVGLVQPVDTGNPREDLLATGRAIAQTGSPGINLLPALAGEAVTNPEFGRVFKKNLVEPRRAQFRGFLERGVAAGELRQDADLEFLTDVVMGTILFRSQNNAGTFDTLVDDQERLWDIVVESAGTPKGKRALAKRRRQGA